MGPRRQYSSILFYVVEGSILSKWKAGSSGSRKALREGARIAGEQIVKPFFHANCVE